VLVTATVVVAAAALASGGARVGWRISALIRGIHLRGVDATLGAIVSALGTLFATWLIAVSLAAAPQAGIGSLVQHSAVIGRLDEMLPPVPEIAARLGRLIDPLGLPRVFVGLEPAPAAPVPGPTSEQVRAVAEVATKSMVRITGAGCGGVLIGSGFIVAPGLVMTNAHVIAGITSPTVEHGTSTFNAVPVLFDPAIDLAVLRVDELDGPVLAFASDLASRGEVGAVLGYPSGYGLTIAAAAVLDHYDALGRDIYDQAIVTRPVIEIQATVLPGDSGGPLVLADGQVAGVVFARSLTHTDIGYAIASTGAAAALATASTANHAASTGSCAAD
jgi:S1-C subfamily serine protease